MAATDPNDTVYKTRSLSKWFAIASIILLISVVWAVLQDYDRDWKRYSRQAHRIQAAIGERKLREAEAALDLSKLNGLKAQVAELEKQQSDLTGQLDAEIQKLQADYYRKNQDFQFAKANLDAHTYLLDEATKEQKPEAAKLKHEWNQESARVGHLKDAADTAAAKRDDALAQKADLLSQQKAANDKMAALGREIAAQEKVIKNNAMNLTNVLRNAPVVDFISPTVKITQVVLPNLLDDYSFNKVPRVDRCMTCHAMIEKPGFEDYPQPFRTHPKVGLYMGPDSPHPMEKIGCTVCHAGIPQSVDFSLAAHTPRDLKQEQEWVEKYGYRRGDHVPTPMLPTAMVEGKCIQCHAHQIELTDAPTFNAGMKLVQRYGCYGCHKFAGHFEALQKEKKPGPTLKTIASKVSEDWIRKWLREPKFFRPTTLMPQYWGVQNNSDPAAMARNLVEIDAIAHFIVKKSVPYQPIQLASNSVGDASHGKQLVGSIGCLGCHAVDDFPRKNPDDPKAFGWKDPRVPMFGPELNQMGSKVSKEWLFSWLSNPKHYWENTSMPNLKLTGQEALDITAYLLSKRNGVFEQWKFPDTDDKVRDDVVLTYYKALMTTDDAKTKLASMSLEDKRMFLGEKLVNHYGCYGCHAISGFEKVPNIGAELSYEGSKDPSKFAFDNVDIEHTRNDWLFTKIRTPRIWDVGKMRDFEGKARMPHFGFTHDQANAITAIVMGSENKNITDEALFKVDGRWEQIIAGQRIIRRYNCVGCHAIEGKGGEILAHYSDDITNGPPILNTEGLRTQPDWLFNFLRSPTVMIRPWLKVRMPQFFLTEQETSELVKYFSAYDKASFPFIAKHFDLLSSADEKTAEALFNKQGCLTCHAVRKPGEDVSQAAPHLANVKARLRGEWVARWLHNPSAIMPGTRMPSLWPPLNEDDPKAGNMAIPGFFGDNAEAQMSNIRNFLYTYGGSAEVPPVRLYDPYNNDNVTGLNPGPAKMANGAPAAPNSGAR